MNLRKTLQQRNTRRANRTRAKLHGTGSTPRLSVHRTNRFIYAQLIDDKAMKTVAAASSKQLAKAKRTKTEEAAAVGELIAQKAKDKGISKVIFDRGEFRYHGRVKAVAEAARKAGLEF